MQIKFSVLLYNFLIRLYKFGIFCASPINKKARDWISGRKNWREKLKDSIFVNQNYIWFHCASYGEYIQAKPLIKAVHKKFANYKIVLSFFSPSGYQMVKPNAFIYKVFYLPVDSKSNADYFVNTLNPKLVIFVKYEWWYNFFISIRKNQIPFYVVAANFRKDQIFFKSYGYLHRKMIDCVDTIFVQKKNSKDLLNKIDKQNVKIAGDTRFDEVYETRLHTKVADHFMEFKNDQKLLLFGSSYQTEESYALKLSLEQEFSKFKFLIVPHEINQLYLLKLKNQFKNALLYSEGEKNGFSEIRTSQTLIIDKIGLLFSLYQIADFSIVGGGFGKGIHNILEPVSANSPVFIGPNYNKSNEARELINNKSAFSFNSYTNLKEQLHALSANPTKQDEIKTAYQKYVEENCGATDIILNEIKI